VKERLTQQTEQAAAHVQIQNAQGSAELEFKSVEDALRFDAAQTEVPPKLEERILKEAPSESKKPWWKRWLR
jgi:hypothetical protein